MAVLVSLAVEHGVTQVICSSC